MKYFITYHAIERLKERFSVFYNQQPELKNWKKEHGLGVVKSLFDIWVEKAEENRSYLNNTVYMLKLYEKYGYDTEYCFKEFKQENILFVFIKARSENHYKLVTLMPTEYRPTIKNIKYNHKQTKEEKHTANLMQWYDGLDSSNKQAVRNNLNQQVQCTGELKELLIKLVTSGQTEILGRLSHSKTIHKVAVEDIEYEFIYSKTASGVKEITLQKRTEIDIQCKALEEYQKYLSLDLKRELLVLVHNNQTKVEKLSNTRSRHYVAWQGVEYHFLYQKAANGDRNIILEKAPQIASCLLDENLCAQKTLKLR